ncbi:MAG: RDD family protein [Pseudomonadota bacterium]|nr:RDD family protein [Pseudomonadota bacterium]
MGFQPAGLARRLAAIFLDSLVLGSLIFIAAQPLPLIPEDLQSQPLIRLLKQIYLLSIAWLYFGWFWTHGGQTVGMRAWRIKVIAEDGSALDWGQATRRYLAAILSWLPAGLGYWWSLFDSDKRAWHDSLSRSRLLVLPKAPKRRK